MHYFPGWGEMEYEDEDDASMRYRISMSEIRERLPHDVSIDNLYFTASFDDDHLFLKVCYDEKVSLYEQKMKKYEDEMEEWKIRKEMYDKEMVRYEQALKTELASLNKK